MKIFLLYVFTFAGLLITSASMLCSDAEIQKRCLPYPKTGDSNLLNAEEKWCKTFIPMMDCLIKEAERCPDNLNAKRIDEHREGREAANSMCSKFQNLKAQSLLTVTPLEMNCMYR